MPCQFSSWFACCGVLADFQDSLLVPVPAISSLLERSKTNQKHVAKIRQPDGVGVVTKQLQVAAASDPKYCSEYAHVN
jgi:hypothetical protein